MTKTIHQFYTEVINKKFDIDGYYGAQCWDGAMYYSKWLGYPVYNCGISGYVKDIWNQRKTSGILNYYTEVSTSKMQDGDIAIWDNCQACPSSHIAIFRKDNGNGTGIFLGQNQGGVDGAFSQNSIPYAGLLGALRPKCFNSTPKPTSAVTHYVGYTCHSQDIGWQKEVFDGATGGVTGKSKRLEAFKLRTLQGGTVEYVKLHIQDIGWKTYKAPGANTVLGTVGKKERIEDVSIKLDGFKFRVHIQGSGWTDWSNCDGVSTLGTVGQSLRIEAIQIKKN